MGYPTKKKALNYCAMEFIWMRIVLSHTLCSFIVSDSPRYKSPIIFAFHADTEIHTPQQLSTIQGKR